MVLAVTTVGVVQLVRTIDPNPTSQAVTTPINLPTRAADDSPLDPNVPSPNGSVTPTDTPVPTTTEISNEVYGTLSVYFLDVGQGDSILLQGPDFTILIDAGRHNADDVVPQLEQIGITSLDLLVGTHPHADHIGQFPEVLARYPVSEVWMSGDINTTQTFERALDAIEASDAAYAEPRAGETYQFGSTLVEILHPAHATGDINDGSIVIRVVFGEVAFLFAGDAEASSEQAMLASGRNLAAQVLKLGHHGSNTSSTLPFLQAVHPEIAIWSAGLDNSYGHPHAEVLQRLAELGIDVLGTAANGTLAFCTDGHTYTLGDCAMLPPAAVAPPSGQSALPPSAPATQDTAATTHISGCAPGQIDINTASKNELDRIYQIGPARATAMINLRPFSSVDDMERISGISAARVEAIKSEGLACVD